MNYHAHIYYELSTKEQAEEFRQQIIKDWPSITVHPLINRKVGPHPSPMFEVDFSDDDYSQIRDYLEATRDNFSVLIHPLIEDEFKAHTTEAVWLGKVLKLNTDILIKP